MSGDSSGIRDRERLSHLREQRNKLLGGIVVEILNNFQPSGEKKDSPLHSDNQIPNHEPTIA